MVLPSHRALGLTNNLLIYLLRSVGPAVGGEEFWGESVTNHVFMQRAVLAAEGVFETGIELEIMPAVAYAKERSAPGRVSAVVVYFPGIDKPHDVCLPPVYEELMTEIYGRQNRKRALREGIAPLPEGGQTRLAHTYIAGAGVLRVNVLAAGRDVAEKVSALVRTYEEAGAEVFQVFLPLDKAYSGALTEALNGQGFFFGAVMHRWFDADGLLLQKLPRPTDYDGIHLYSDFAQRLLAFIIEDRRRVT